MDIYTAEQVYDGHFIGHPSEVEAEYRCDEWFMTRRQKAYWSQQIEAYRAIWDFKYPYDKVLYGSLQS